MDDLWDVNTGQLRTQHAMPVDTCVHGPDMTGQTPVAIVHLFAELHPIDFVVVMPRFAQDIRVFNDRQQSEQ